MEKSVDKVLLGKIFILISFKESFYSRKFTANVDEF